ncbi:MAG: glycosyltransferase [Bacteroidales bacterium]|jgi:glycosyltransferase involved in cell wall biosynthesis|nr:glycosyltransferase [Bacteroidales bacterium]
MNSVTIIGTAYPFRGGLAAYNERLAREFIAHGVTVEMETFTLQYPNILFPGKSQYADWPPPTGLTIRRSLNSVNPVSWLSAGGRMARQQPDVVVVKYWLPFMAPCFGTVIRRIKSNKHSKIICIADNIVPHEPHPGTRLLTHYFLNAVDGIVAMSNSVLRDAAVFRPAALRALCPHPLFDSFGEKIAREEAVISLGLDPAVSYMLFFGFIRDYKGLDLLLNAISLPQLRNMPVKLLVAGEFYTDPAPYHALIRELKIEDKVIIMDKFIADAEVNRYFCAADIVVQPYKNATQSGVTQIGYHFDKPMLVTDVGGLAEIIPDGKVGYVVQPAAEAIARALIDFYTGNRQIEFERNVAEEKKRFSWEAMYLTIENMYKQLTI